MNAAGSKAASSSVSTVPDPGDGGGILRPGLRRCRTIPSYRRPHSLLIRDHGFGLLDDTAGRSHITRDKTPLVSQAGLTAAPRSCSLFVDDLSLQTIDRRYLIISELCETEQTYFDSLTMIQDNIIDPLFEYIRQEKPILDSGKMSALFSNFVDLLHISSALLATLQAKQNWHELSDPDMQTSRNDTVGQVFKQFGHYFKVYKTYCRNFRSSATEIEREILHNVEFARFLSTSRSKAALAGMSLQSLLLLPVQRIPRYRSLLQRLLKWTPPTHSEHTGLREAVELISDIAESINEDIRQYESWQELLKIQRSILALDEPLIELPSRIFHKRGDILKICRSSHQLRTLFLFSDCLLITKYVGPPAQTLRMFSRRVQLLDVVVEMEFIEPRHVKESRFYWKIVTSEKSFRAYCTTQVEVDLWLAAIRQAKSRRLMTVASISLGKPSQSTIAITRSRLVKPYDTPVLSAIYSAFWEANDVEYPILRGHHAPIWTEDSASSCCQRCEALFTLFRTRHHCRICGSLVCAACSGQWFMRSTRSDAFRACTLCYQKHFSPSKSF